MLEKDDIKLIKNPRDKLKAISYKWKNISESDMKLY